MSKPLYYVALRRQQDVESLKERADILQKSMDELEEKHDAVRAEITKKAGTIVDLQEDLQKMSDEMAAIESTQYTTETDIDRLYIELKAIRRQQEEANKAQLWIELAVIMGYVLGISLATMAYMG